MSVRVGEMEKTKEKGASRSHGLLKAMRWKLLQRRDTGRQINTTRDSRGNHVSALLSSPAGIRVAVSRVL